MERLCAVCQQPVPRRPRGRPKLRCDDCNTNHRRQYMATRRQRAEVQRLYFQPALLELAQWLIQPKKRRQLADFARWAAAEAFNDRKHHLTVDARFHANNDREATAAMLGRLAAEADRLAAAPAAPAGVVAHERSKSA